MKNSFFIYLVLLATMKIAFTIVYIATVNILQWQGVELLRLPYQELYFYQAGKLPKSEASIIFVGDSALGNSVDAKHFFSLSGMKSENLALTGRFGFLGSLRMLERALYYNSNIETVVVMQTIDMMTREPAPDFIPPRRFFAVGDFRGIDLSVLDFASLKLLVRLIFNGPEKGSVTMIRDDYIKQNKRLGPSRVFKLLETDMIQEGKEQVLANIVNLCRQHNLNCLYMHAPVVTEICSSKEYLDRVNQIIRATEIQLVSDYPVCISRDELGDSSDHVHPEKKKLFTERQYRLLQPFLVSSSEIGKP